MLTAVAVPQAHALDAADKTLETELAGEIATRLIETYNSAAQAAPGFETFELLFDAYQSLRKWQAYLDAMDAAQLPITAGPYAEIKAAVERVGAASIDAKALATAAVEALRGVGDWHAADKAQADLVIQHLGKLVTELADPRLRLISQSILAEVELDSDAPMAAAARIVAAVPDIRRLESGPEQLELATQFATMLQSLDAPYSIEVTSEIVAAIGSPEQRAQLVSTLAGGFAAKARARLDAAAANPATASDPLALAWSAQAPGSTLDAAAVAITVGGGIDPLPVLIALAEGVDTDTRQSVCTTLVDTLIASGDAIRGLNLARRLGGDCPPATGLALAADFAARDLPGLARPLLGDVFARSTEATEIAAAANILEALGDVAGLGAHADVLGTDRTATMGRAAIRQVLLDRKAPIDAAALAYPPTAAMQAVLSGETAGTDFTATDADLALFRDVGRTLANQPEGSVRLAAFAASTAPLDARLAIAAGYTGALAYNVEASPDLTAALTDLTAGPIDNPDASLILASVGQLDPAPLGDGTSRDRLIERAARQRAWSGDQEDSRAWLARIADPAVAARLSLDLAAIEAVVGDFDVGVARLREHAETPERVEAFRFVARERAERLDIHDWIEGGRPLDLTPATLVNASIGDGPVIHHDEHLNVRPSGAVLPAGKPQLPDLGVASSDVTRAVPYPTGGAAGVVVGGEGRYVRLGGFDSPYFDGESNNGVRDYVYEQNKTITPEFIFLNQGVFTIADVVDAIGRDQLGAIDVLPGSIVRFNRPVAVGPEATLILSGAEAREIQLNATTGAFIVNAGKLDVVGTRIVGYDVENDRVLRRSYESAMHRFRPFLLGWSGSVTNLADSEFVALGYSAGRSYGVTFNAGPVDDYYERARPAAPTGTIVNNNFDNLYYGFYAYEAADVQLVGNEYRNSIIYGIDPHDRSKRLNISLNTAYGTAKKHGIIISREVNDSFIVGNLSFDNYGSGTMLDRSSVGTLVFANTLRGNHGDGMAVFESPCTIVGMNDIGGNNRAGIKVRNSWDVLLLQNRIESNKGSGIEGFISDLAASEGSAGRNFTTDPYQAVTAFSAIGNGVRGNGAGIQTAGASTVELYGNQFRNQSARLVAGDLNGLQGLVLQQAAQSPVLISSNCRPVLQPTHACSFVEAGLMAQSRFTTSQTGDACTGDASTIQAQAFSVQQ